MIRDKICVSKDRRKEKQENGCQSIEQMDGGIERMVNIRQRQESSCVVKERGCVSAAHHWSERPGDVDGRTYLQELADEGERH